MNRLRPNAWILRTLILSGLLTWCAYLPAQQAGMTIQERLGYPSNSRLLIIHADDLGMTQSVNRATLEALEHSWITSASIMVPCPWFPEVVRWARRHPDADLGIHLTLNSEWTDFRWGPLTARATVPTLVDADGYLLLDEIMVGQHAKPEEADTELRAQVDRALAAGIAVTHLDTHMTALMQTAGLFEVYQRLGTRYKVAILFDKAGNPALPQGASLSPRDAPIDRVVAIPPGVPAKAWSRWYETALAALPPGVYQMTVHLAYDNDEMRAATGNHPDWGAAWRQSDFDMLKSAEFQKFLKNQGFILITWRQLQKEAIPSVRNSHVTEPHVGAGGI